MRILAAFGLSIVCCQAQPMKLRITWQYPTNHGTGITFMVRQATNNAIQDVFSWPIVYTTFTTNADISVSNVNFYIGITATNQGVNFNDGLSPVSVINYPFTSWYLDNAVTNNGDGKSWSTAWKSFTNITWNAIQAGDTLFISGGTTSKVYFESNYFIPFYAAFHPEKGGIMGFPITITVGRDSGHDGKVILDAQNKLDCLVYSGFDWTIFDGGPNTNFWLINNLSPTNRQSGYGYIGGSSSHQRVSRIVCSNLNTGIHFNGGYDVEVCSNRVVYITAEAAISLACNGANWDDIKVHHNFIQTVLDNSGTPTTRFGGADAITCMGGISIYNNELINNLAAGWTNGSGQHPDGIQTTGFFKNAKVYNNRFHGFYNSVFEIDPADDNAHDIYIWNNVFSYDNMGVNGASHKVAEFSGGKSGISNVFWFNNTFVNWTGDAYPWGWEWDKSGIARQSVTNFGIWNNIWYNCGPAYLMVFGTYANTNFSSNSVSIAYNLLNEGTEGGGNTIINVGLTSSGNYTLTNYNGVTNAPAFASYYPNNPNNNYKLLSGSAGTKTGTNLTSFMQSKGLTMTTTTGDFDGSPRPTTSAWDMGAYQTP